MNPNDCAFPGAHLGSIRPSTNSKAVTAWSSNKAHTDFPGGTVVKNLPVNAGDTGLSPGPGRFLHAAEQLSPCATTTEPARLEPARLEPVLHNKRSHRNEKPTHRNKE